LYFFTTFAIFTTQITAGTGCPTATKYERKTNGDLVTDCFVVEHADADNMNVFQKKWGINNFDHLKHHLEDVAIVYPTTVFRNMITPGISISNTRIAMLHINGAITDLVCYNILL